MAAPKKRPPAQPPAPRYGLLRIMVTIGLMTAVGAALGVLAAHIGH